MSLNVILCEIMSIIRLIAFGICLCHTLHTAMGIGHDTGCTSVIYCLVWIHVSYTQRRPGKSRQTQQTSYPLSLVRKNLIASHRLKDYTAGFILAWITKKLTPRFSKTLGLELFEKSNLGFELLMFYC